MRNLFNGIYPNYPTIPFILPPDRYPDSLKRLLISKSPHDTLALRFIKNVPNYIVIFLFSLLMYSFYNIFMVMIWLGRGYYHHKKSKRYKKAWVNWHMEDGKSRKEAEKSFKEWKRREKQPKKYGKRGRALSIGGEGVQGVAEVKDIEIEGMVMRRTDVQDRSLLFRLPLEIRQKIWEEVVGGYFILIRSLYGRVQHTRWKGGPPGLYSAKWHAWGESQERRGRPDNWGQRSLLSLLMTCRRIYTEAIFILYNRNALDFPKFKDVRELGFIVRTTQLECIRHGKWRPKFDGVDNHPRYVWRQYDGPEECFCLKCTRAQLEDSYAKNDQERLAAMNKA